MDDAKETEPEKKLETVEESWQSKLLKSNKDGFAELNSKLSKIESMLSDQIVVVEEPEDQTPPPPKQELISEPIEKTPPPPKSRRESRQAKKLSRRGK